MDPGNGLLLFLAGTAAGFVNVVAGGGSFITMPLLMTLAGLPATTANGTNRVAILMQNAFATKNFRNHGHRDTRVGLELGLPAAAGAVLGSKIALEVPDRVFEAIFATVMLLALAVILRPGKRRMFPAGGKPKNMRILVPAFFLVGLYGGFIQAGTGYLVIFTLSVIGGLSLVKTNSIKIIVITVYLIPSLAVFLAGGEVRWIPGLVLGAGNSLGGWMGTYLAVSRNEGLIRVVLAVVMVFLSLKMFGVF